MTEAGDLALVGLLACLSFVGAAVASLLGRPAAFFLACAFGVVLSVRFVCLVPEEVAQPREAIYLRAVENFR